MSQGWACVRCTGYVYRCGVLVMCSNQLFVSIQVVQCSFSASSKLHMMCGCVW